MRRVVSLALSDLPPTSQRTTGCERVSACKSVTHPLTHASRKKSHTGTAQAATQRDWQSVTRSLTQSLPLLPFGCGGRYLHTDKSKDIRHDKRGSKRLRSCRFSIGSAPLTSITKI